MLGDPSVATPPGWYPDPAGERAWRQWNGAAWLDDTREFGAAGIATSAGANYELVLALRRLLTLGVVGVVGGFALFIGVLAHWPRTAHPTPLWFAVGASNLAVALLVLGTVVSAFGVRELRGRWTYEAFLPAINFFVASALVGQRLGRYQPLRLVSEVILLLIFAAQLRHDLFFAAIPVFVAYTETTWFSALAQRLSGPVGAVDGP